MNRLRWIWPAVILASAAACGVLTALGTGGAARALIAVWFLGVCPGMALVYPLRLKDPLMEFTLGVALSITLDTIIASAQVYAHAWAPNVGLAILLAISVVGALVALPQRVSRPALLQ